MFYDKNAEKVKKYAVILLKNQVSPTGRGHLPPQKSADHDDRGPHAIAAYLLGSDRGFQNQITRG